MSDLRDNFPHADYIRTEDGSPHRFYYEEYGPKDATPLIMVHGNSGAIFDPQKLTGFDFSNQRVIFPHMRGVGLSEPAGQPAQNLYPDLAEDIETLRRQLGVDKVRLFGWSGGTGVALLYAEKYSQHCESLALYGTWLGTRDEVLGYYERSVEDHPENWQEFFDWLGTNDVGEALARHSVIVLRGAPEAQLDAAIRYEKLFEAPGLPLADFRATRSPQDWRETLGQRKIFCHMLETGYGVAPGQIERDLPKLGNMPVLFVTGADDHITPPPLATSLAAKLLTGRAVVIEGAGHDVHDPMVQTALRPLLADFSGIPAASSTAPLPVPAI